MSVDMSVVEKYSNFASFNSRENYLIHEAKANKDTLEYLLNDESDESMAELIRMLLSDKEEKTIYREHVLLRDFGGGLNNGFCVVTFSHEQYLSTKKLVAQMKDSGIQKAELPQGYFDISPALDNVDGWEKDITPSIDSYAEYSDGRLDTPDVYISNGGTISISFDFKDVSGSLEDESDVSLSDVKEFFKDIEEVHSFKICFHAEISESSIGDKLLAILYETGYDYLPSNKGDKNYYFKTSTLKGLSLEADELMGKLEEENITLFKIV